HGEKPRLWQESEGVVRCEQRYLGTRKLHCEGAQELLFTENETNFQRINYSPNRGRYVKDGINDYIVHCGQCARSPLRTGTKVAARYGMEVGPGETKVVRLRFAEGDSTFDDFDQIFATRMAEADEFYAPLCDCGGSKDLQQVQRQGFAGMLWSKQF